MEVHHHPQVGKKSFKEYFLEFIMIFLAVTLGFFAENIRESWSEHSREKEYAALLWSDLRSDSTFYVQRKERISSLLPGFDSLFRILVAPLAPTSHDLIEKFLPLSYQFGLEITATTYNEMRSSGSLRLIRDQTLRKKLQNYYEVYVPREQLFVDLCDRFYSQYIIPYNVDNIRAQDWDFKTDSLVTLAPEFANRSKQSDQRMANITWLYGHLLEAYVRVRQDPSAAQCKNLMALLKDEYHLEGRE